MFKASTIRSMIVDHDSREGKEYMIARIRHNFTVNKLVYGMIIIPLLYLPFHFVYSQGVMWRDYESPYFTPPDQKQKWRKNKYRKEEEEVVGGTQGWYASLMSSGWFGVAKTPEGEGESSSPLPVEKSQDEKLSELKTRQVEILSGAGGSTNTTRSLPKMRPLFLREDGEGKGGDWGFTSKARLEEERKK